MRRFIAAALAVPNRLIYLGLFVPHQGGLLLDAQGRKQKVFFNKRCEAGTENGASPVHPVTAGFAVVETLNNFRPERARRVH